MAIYKDTKRNTWYFRIYVTNSNGKKVQKCRSGFKTKTEAKIAETTYLNNSRLNILNLSFEELYTIYIQDKTQKLKYQSIRTIKNRFENHILPYFKDYNIKDITHKEYIEWKEKIIKKEYSY